MTDKEMALQITLQAIQSGMIIKDRGDTRATTNSNVADSISEFFIKIYKTVFYANEIINDEVQQELP